MPREKLMFCFRNTNRTILVFLFCFCFLWMVLLPSLRISPQNETQNSTLTNPIRYQTSLNIISNVHDCLPEFRSHGRCSSWCTEPCPGAEAVVLMAPRPLCVDIWPTERPSAIPSLFGQFNSLLVPRVRGKEVDCGCKYAINTVAHGNSHEGLANCLACFYEVG